jgi:succinate dehydrogenase / fumarate reductase membrane anchor subunit
MSLLKWEKGGLKSNVARANGLGSAKDGVEHWMAQRVTSVSSLILVVWFLYSLLSGVALDYVTFTTWLQAPLNAILLILFSISVLYHSYLGCQVVVEDYIHNEGFKMVKMIGMKLTFFAAGVACIFSILKISFGL